MKNHLTLLLLSALALGVSFNSTSVWAFPKLTKANQVPEPIGPNTAPTPPIKILPITTGSCSSEKEGYTKVDKSNLFYCDGTKWQVLALDSTSKTCPSSQLGKYSITADKKLEFCNGTNWLATGDKIVEACAQELYGKMKFAKNTTGTTGKMIQFCDGSNWLDTSTKMADSGAPIVEPDIFCAVNMDYSPRCGVDNKVYKNQDSADCAGVAVKRSATTNEIALNFCSDALATCESPMTFYCGSDKIDYYSGCGMMMGAIPQGVTLTLGTCASAM